MFTDYFYFCREKKEFADTKKEGAQNSVRNYGERKDERGYNRQNDRKVFGRAANEKMKREWIWFAAL